MIGLFKPKEPEPKVIKALYNDLTAIEKKISVLEAENDAIKRKLHSLAGKVYREAYLEQKDEKEKPFIGLSPFQEQ